MEKRLFNCLISEKHFLLTKNNDNKLIKLVD